jgi:hypothetical protein
MNKLESSDKRVRKLFEMYDWNYRIPFRTKCKIFLFWSIFKREKLEVFLNCIENGFTVLNSIRRAEGFTGNNNE